SDDTGDWARSGLQAGVRSESVERGSATQGSAQLPFEGHTPF
ncbi:hypothetical protein CF641_37755, partial [Burkholderia pseudomallei]